MLNELNLNTFAISFNYQVRLQKAIQLGPAIQFKSKCSQKSNIVR